MAAAEPSPASNRPRLRFAEIALVLVALLLPLLGLEVFLRLKGDSRSWTQPDPLLGWSYIPGAAYAHEPAEKCPGWGAKGRINSLGLRDREIEMPKPDGVVRVLALGDSFTEAFHFDPQHTWTKLLEAALNARGDGRRYEVVNAGRSGMGTTLEWIYFANRGRELDADLVVLLFIPNDFQDNSKRLALATAYGPYLVPDENGGFRLDTSFLSSRDYRMRTRLTSIKRFSYAASAGIDRYKAWRAVRAARAHAAARGERLGHVDVAAREGQGLAWTEEDFLWVAEPQEEWLEAARVTQEALLRLSTSVAEEDAQLVVFGGTSRIQVHPDAIAETMREHPDWDLDGPAGYVRAAALQGGFAFHDLAPALREAAAAGDVSIHGCPENGGEGHWSEAGHRAAAAEMARFLDSSGLLAPAAP